MAKISDSSGANVDLKENKNSTLWRRFIADELPAESTALDGYVPFFRLEPRGADPIEITNITVVDNTIEFQFETIDVPGNKCAYVFGWIDPSAKVETLMYGQVILV